MLPPVQALWSPGVPAPFLGAPGTPACPVPALSWYVVNDACMNALMAHLAEVGWFSKARTAALKTNLH